MRAPGWSACSACPARWCPADGMELKKSRDPRGRNRNGMMCSTRELELGDDHEGIIELPADAPVGTRLRRLPAAPTRCSTWRSPPTGPTAWASTASRAISPRRGWARSSRSRVEPVAGQLPLPGRDPHRRSRRLPGVLRPRHPRRDATAPRPTGCRRGCKAPGSGRSRRWSTSPTT